MFSTASTLGDQLTDEVRASFKVGEKSVPMGGRAIFNPEMTTNRTEVFRSGIVDKFGSRTSDGGVFASVDETAGDELTMNQYKVTISMEVTEMEEFFDQYGITPRLLSLAEGIGTGLVKRMEMDCQQFIKNGAGSSYTDADGNTVSVLAADGYTLFYSSGHTVNGSSSTYVNTDSSSFGQTGIETHLDFFRKFLNHDGQRANRRPNLIYSTEKAALTNLIAEFAQSLNHVEDQNRGINTYRGRFQHVVLEYLDTTTAGADDTSTDDYWGMAIMNGPNMKLRISKAPELLPVKKGERTNNTIVQGQTWYAVGVHDPIDITLAAA